LTMGLSAVKFSSRYKSNGSRQASRLANPTCWPKSEAGVDKGLEGT
jgi:hypothetical protein